MISNFTMTLGELLALKGFNKETNTSSDDNLNKILSSLASDIPNFVFSNERVDLNINFEEMFIENYHLREIGSETAELFIDNWKRILNKAIINYVPKINMWLDNFNDLFKFTVRLSYTENSSGTGSETGTGSNSNSNNYYLNPVNVNGNLKLDNKNDTNSTSTASNETEFNNTKSYGKDVLQSVWGKTRANLLSQILELRNIYTELLDYFEQIFMGVY